MTAPAPLPPKSILIVEDDPDIRGMLKFLFAQEGYQVATAENGRVALDHLRSSSKPHLILLDLLMPVMDARGFRAIQESDPEISDIPVVVMSADGAIEFKGLRLGLNRYVKKPLDVDLLLATVESVLAKR